MRTFAALQQVFDVSFSCIRCSANSVAHSLTRYSSQIDNEIV